MLQVFTRCHGFGNPPTKGTEVPERHRIDCQASAFACSIGSSTYFVSTCQMPAIPSNSQATAKPINDAYLQFLLAVYTLHLLSRIYASWLLLC
jgi:hypothetical protein